MTTVQAPVVSIHDFTVTIDTRASEGDKVVLRLDRDGHEPMHVPCSAEQLVWLLNDPVYFANGYKFTLFKRIAELREAGKSFDEIGADLGVDAEWARGLFDETTAAMHAQVA